MTSLSRRKRPTTARPTTPSQTAINLAGLDSLFFELLPYIEQDNVYRRFKKGQPDTYYGKDGAAGLVVKTYVSPADTTAPVASSYPVNEIFPFPSTIHCGLP